VYFVGFSIRIVFLYWIKTGMFVDFMRGGVRGAFISF
jgi:hypothetical protein